MSKNKGLKEKIIKMRKEGLSYNKIANKLNCSKAVISYHCKRYNLNDIGLTKEKIGDETIEKISDYYLTHTAKETSDKFGISVTTIKKYKKESKINRYSEEEKKKLNYQRVKNYRQKIKEKSVKYKGGKCGECGYDKCNAALEFHHKNPKEKDFNPCGQSISWEKMKKEIDKCILLCANCHRELHHNLYIDNLYNELNNGK